MNKTFAGALGAALLLATPPSHAITVGFAPATQNVNVGVPVNVALVILGLGNGAAPSLSTFDLDVTFDGNILSFLGATFGDPVLGEQLDLFGFGSLTSVAPGLGVVNLFELSLDSPADLNALQAASFTLATLTFSTPSAGFSNLGIAVNALGDAHGDSLAATIALGSVTSMGSTAVSEPVSLLLVLAGLMALACLQAIKTKLSRGGRI
jgi:hypothetical protein